MILGKSTYFPLCDVHLNLKSLGLLLELVFDVKQLHVFLFERGKALLYILLVIMDRVGRVLKVLELVKELCFYEVSLSFELFFKRLSL